MAAGLAAEESADGQKEKKPRSRLPGLFSLLLELLSLIRDGISSVVVATAVFVLFPWRTLIPTADRRPRDMLERHQADRGMGLLNATSVYKRKRFFNPLGFGSLPRLGSRVSQRRHAALPLSPRTVHVIWHLESGTVPIYCRAPSR